ncbi:polymorphic toxin-type HINT domain-containing protein [Acinetobacter calcoaceticus]|uniref:polymorphic toxin-type HINT domain-containing protein n=1 Tax=Acinetobacter calcoaceticus TaxID=471 RepID=UPI00300ADE08
MNTRKGILTKELIFIAKKDNNLKISSRAVDPSNANLSTTLTHESLSSFQEWSPLTMDVNGDEIDDLVIYGRNINQQVSLLFFISSYDSTNNQNRKFTFYKELKNISINPAPLLNISQMDGDGDGVQDIVLTSGNTNDLRFNGVKLDLLGNLITVKTTIIGPTIRNKINSSSGRAKLTDRILSGNFRRGKNGDIILYYTNSSGLSLCSINVFRDVILSDQTIDSCGIIGSTPLIESQMGESYKDYDFSVADFNKDGLDDIIVSKLIRVGTSDSTTQAYEYILPILSNGRWFEVHPFAKTPVFDIYTNGWSANENWDLLWSKPIFVDFNQDGYLDFYRYNKRHFDPVLVSFLQRPNYKFDIYLNNIGSWWKPYTSPERELFTSLGYPYVIDPDNYNVDLLPFLTDFNLNGFQEINLQYIVRPKNSTGAYVYSLFSQSAKTDLGVVAATRSSSDLSNALRYPDLELPDMLKSISTGDGNKQQFGYSIFTQAPESQVAKSFPIRGTNSSILVTNSVYNYLNDILGSKVTYSYSAPRVDIKENRFLGFEKQIEKLESYNNPSDINAVTNTLEKETLFNQNYPFIGMAKSVVTKANGALVSKLSVADADFVSDSAYPSTKVKFPRIKKSTVENYELGTLVSKTVTANNYENVFGNLTDSTVTTSSADGTNVFTTTVKPTYGTADQTNWIPGLIKDQVMTTSRTGQTPIQTKTSYEYDTKRQVIKKIDEPDDPALKLQTDYSYDAYGNVTKVSLTGTGNGTDTGATRTVSSAYEAGTGYPAGVFKTRETNALSQQSTATYDAVTGQLLTSTDINGVTSTQKIDALGRVIQTKSASGVQTDISYQLCKTFVEVGSNSSECEKGENYKITSTSTLNAPVITYKDANGNVKRTLTKAYDNVNNIVVRNEYTASGRLYRSSSPSLSNVAYANLQWTTYEYDALGRVSKLTEPGNRVTSYTRSGLQTTMTNAKNLKRTEKSNIANEVVEIVDHDNKSLKYSRDALGRITQTTDASGNSISLTLDKNGNKLQQVDPELGTWKYRYNVLGQPVWQQDGKGQQTTFQYDSLGRLIKRTEPDLTSTWTWDSATKGKGQLAQVSSTNGFSESYSYDSYGRQIQTTTSKKIDPIAQGTTDPDFITKWNYDNAGRMLAFAYPTGFGYRNIYDTNGYLKEVRNLAGTQLYWSADARDARGNVTAETLGNGLVTKRAYKAETGFIESISTGDAKVQQNTYSFDALGNLTNRNQNLAGISVNETFSYDNINRLTSVVNQSGGKVTATYDAIGNLTAKSDTGTYNYATGGTSCGVHKVCTISSTTGGLNTAFSYDANGNQLSGNNRSYSWTSFNMPLQIKQGTTTESFMYDANHERVRRTSVENGKTTTTLYINPRIDTGGTFQKSYLPDGTAEYTHYLYAGGDVLGSYVSKDKGTPPTADLGLTAQAGVAPNSAKAAVSKTGPYRYFHSDHLTSIEVITDATGAVVERLSYDPWGKRRNADGTVATTVLKGTKDSHGFTSHEMLDSIGLVHMNGRVYDPQVGRFTSADPLIDGADNLQGYNRYSYVHNNPGTLLDPSGYSWLSKKWKSFTGFLKDAMVTVTDDWLGSCSGNQGNCGVTVGVTYGPNNQGIGSQNDGRNTVQPYIGFGGSVNHDDYSFHFTYDSNGLTFDKFYYPQQYALPGSNYIDIATLRAAFDFSYSVDDYITYFDMPQDISAKLSTSAYGSDDDKAARRAWLAYQLGDGIAAYGAYTEINPLAGLGNRKYLANKASDYLKSFYPCGCFDDDTPVLTKDGYKRIVEIKEGDLVLARHEETGEIAYKPVKRVFVVPNRRIYLLKTINNVGKENIIEVSEDHPFWVVDKKWVNSIDLEKDDQLLDANNQVHKVISITETDRVETTYNLEVEGYHTYFAGDASIWVHNNNCDILFKTLSKKNQTRVSNIADTLDMTVHQAIRSRNGNTSALRQLDSRIPQMKVYEILNDPELKSKDVDTALKLIKQAENKAQKYGGK